MLILATTGCYAQDTLQSLNFNLHAGVALSDASFQVGFRNNEPISKNSVSPVGGVGVEYRFANSFSANLNANYIVTGAEDTGNLFKSIEFSQIQIPITIKGYASDRIYAEAGGYLSAIINADTEVYGDGNNPSYVNTESIDYGILFGLGYSGDSFFISASYSLGFTDLVSLDESNFNPEFDPIIEGGLTDPYFKNRYFVFNAGYRF